MNISKITDANYHTETTHISKSGLDKINISPAHYYNQYLNPESYKVDKKDNADYFLGQVFHTALLEPHLFNERYLVLNQKVDRRTKVGREMWFKYMLAAKGKELVKKEVYEKAMAMVQAVHRKPIAKKLFLNGKAEQIFTATEPNTNVKCKIKVDWVTPDDIMVDLKSALDASCLIADDTAKEKTTNNIYNGFPKSVFNYRYDVQDGFYEDIFKYATGRTPRAFVFVAVEKEPPFEVGLFYLDPLDIEAARQKYLANLRTYKECLETGIWKGYPNEIVKIQSIQQ